jgi:hypothetical protein
MVEVVATLAGPVTIMDRVANALSKAFALALKF